MKNLKKFISAILAVVIIFSVASVAAFAADDTFVYRNEENKNDITYVEKFTGTISEDGYVVVPAVNDGRMVVGIDKEAFVYSEELKGIIIPSCNGFTVDENAIKDMPEDVEIDITADDAKYTFDYYFADDNCSTICLTKFEGTLPRDGYAVIPYVIDGFKVVGIAKHTFDNLEDLKGIIVPSYSEFAVEDNAFYGITHDVEIIVDVTDSVNGEFNPDEWYEAHKQDYVIKGETLMKYKGDDSVVAIPYNCSSVAREAFKGNENITTVYIPKELKVIGESAFEGCVNLADVVVANGAAGMDVGKNAFAGTPWIENYPSEFVNIGTTLIKYKGEPSEVKIPNVFTSIAAEAFTLGDVKEPIAFKVRVPATITNFGEDCFYLYTSVTDVYPELLVYSGSPAEEYLTKEGIKFVYRALPGDIIFDNEITAGDARRALRISAKLDDPIRDDELMSVVDISGNNKITAEDARLILRIAAGLDDYSVDQLLAMPRTDYEVLLTSTNALSLTRAYGCAYSKTEYQYLSNINVNTNSKTYLDMYNKELTSQKKAKTVSYNKDTEEAYNNLFDITLMDTSKIKSYSCAINNGMYEITIVLNDETVNGADVNATTFTSQVFPAAATVDHFTSKAQGKYWYNDDIKYSMTYKDCTLKLSIEIATNKVTAIDVQMNYDFSITGSIMGIAIKGGSGPATARRTDVIKYTNFLYFTKES